MTADLINLRRVKKNLARSEADKQAEANRQKFGQTKAVKSLSAFEKARQLEAHKGHKLND